MAEPPKIEFRDGEPWPALGLGTWSLGEQSSQRSAEVAGLRDALAIGWRVFDTAEMYGDGGAEAVLGVALESALRAGMPRESLRIVSKVLPHHATTAGVQAACERSLKRLRLDAIDLYLLHWRGSVPLAETVRGFELLQHRGLIRRWGVSNFDLPELQSLMRMPGGTVCAANQVCYSLNERGVEFDLLPWQSRQQLPLLAYCPLDQGALLKHPALMAIAQRRQAAPAQVALAWLLRHPGVMPIPKAGSVAHLCENWASQHLRLTDAEIDELGRLYPAPTRKQPLAIR